MNYIPHGGLNKGLSGEQKQAWDHIIETLWKYFETPEGEEFYERFTALMLRIQEAQRNRGISDTESKALAFIRKELKRGHSPTVREVAKALGFRSSRSGYRIVRALKESHLL